MNIIKLKILLFLYLFISFLNAQDCNYYDYNSCNNEFFFEISDEVDKKTFENGERKIKVN